jgi:hypothetical protein
VINQASAIELDAGDIEGIRACIEARERAERVWLSQYEEHRVTICVNGTDEEKKARWAAAVAARTPSKDAWKGLFVDASTIPAEAKVGRRRWRLLARAEFDAECQEFDDFYLEHLNYDFKADWEEYKKKQPKQQKDVRPWPEEYNEHRVTIYDNGTDKKKKAKWAAAVAARTPSKDAYMGLFAKSSKIPAEKAVGRRRQTLLNRAEFDAECEEFHDFYLEHLKYDFKADWEEYKKKQEEQPKQQKDVRPWPEKYNEHRVTIYDNGTDKKKKAKWAAALAARTPSKDAWKGLFVTSSKIPVEVAVGNRRRTLLKERAEFDAECQQFHDFYLKHLKYDFKAEWEEYKKKQKEQQKKGTTPVRGV